MPIIYQVIHTQSFLFFFFLLFSSANLPSVFPPTQMERCECCNQRLQAQLNVAREDVKPRQNMHEADRI